MKIKLILLSSFFIISIVLSAQNNVGINTDTPHESAILELESNETGFLPPRLTEVERDAIANPATGLIIYNLTEHCINYYNGTEWLSLCGTSTGGGTAPIITAQPADDSECETGNVSFTVSASDATAYQWQVNTGSGWNDITLAGSNPTYSGFTSATLTLNGIVASNDGWQYRCVVSGSSPPDAVSNAATLTVMPLPAQPSAIVGDTDVCPATPVSTTEPFNSDFLVHGSSAPTSVWFAPDWNTPIDYNATGGCPDGRIGYSGNWNNYWGNFIRLPEMDCSGNNEISISFDVSHSYFASQTDDWMRFYMWADGGYEHNVISLTIDGVDVLADFGMNGKGFEFTEARNCAEVVVTFDISTIVDKSNILFYLEANCNYNNSNTYFVWFDNITVTTTGSSSYDYSVTDEGHTYTWQVPADWTIDSGQGSNSITVTPGSLDGDVIVTPSNSCGSGTPQSLGVTVCP
jgi:hypothetical protein